MVYQRTTALRAGGLRAFALMVLGWEFFRSRIPIDLLIGRNTPQPKGADDGQFREMA
jgi:hypothetical protein